MLLHTTVGPLRNRQPPNNGLDPFSITNHNFLKEDNMTVLKVSLEERFHCSQLS